MGVNFMLGGKFTGGELFNGFFTQGEFARIFTRSSFYLSCFLIVDSILHAQMFRGDSLGKISVGFRLYGRFLCEG